MKMIIACIAISAFSHCGRLKIGAKRGPVGTGGSGGADATVINDRIPQVKPVERSCASEQELSATVRPLTNLQYDNSVAYLLGSTGDVSRNFSADYSAAFFRGVGEVFPVSQLQVENYHNAAKALAAKAVQNPGKTLACSDNAADRACVKEFVNAFVFKAMRGLSAQGMEDSLMAIYDISPDETGLQIIIETVLQSPNFLYRSEVGQDIGGGKRHLNAFEVASNLSFLILNSTPDQALLEKARNNALGEKEQVLAAAREMMLNASGSYSARFFSKMFQTDAVAGVSRLSDDFTPEIAGLMSQEMDMYIKNVMAKDGGTLGALLTGDYTFVNKDLAAFYGMRGVSSATMEKVTVNKDERSGILTQPGFLTLQAMDDSTHPVKRGAFIREVLLCQALAEPPNADEIELPEVDPNLTTRERFAEHSSNAQCASCHSQIDPIGFGFENYDYLGFFRTEENNSPVDASGEVTDIAEEFQFNGAIDLSAQMAQNRAVHDCVALQFTRYALNLVERSQSSCSLIKSKDKFWEKQGKIDELAISFIDSDQFWYRKAK